jgi:hypothetical protein
MGRPQSSGVTFRRTVFQIRSRERQRLLNVVGCQFGIIPKEIVAVRIQRHGLHDATYRQPHATDARLSVHLVRVPRYAIEALHRSILIHFRMRCRAREHLPTDCTPPSPCRVQLLL